MMVGSQADLVVSSGEDRTFLEAQVRRHKAPRSLLVRCRMALLCTEGLQSNEFAERFGVNEHVKSTSMLEQLNQELKRRTLVVRIFPNTTSCSRLTPRARHRDARRLAGGDTLPQHGISQGGQEGEPQSYCSLTAAASGAELYGGTPSNAIGHDAILQNLKHTALNRVHRLVGAKRVAGCATREMNHGRLG